LTRVGEAFYELAVKDQKLVSSLANAEGKIRSGGVATEQAFGGTATRGMNKFGSAVDANVGKVGRLRSKVADFAGARLGRPGGMLQDAIYGRQGPESFMAKFRGFTKNIGTGIAQGIGISGFFVAAQLGAKFVSVIGDSIKAASDLNETVDKTRITFGGSFAAIDAWSKGSASAFGVSRRAALDYASTFGGLFMNFGLAEDAATDMSKKFVELAADMASFSNATPEEALDALRSGLIGESEPLRRFQVNLSEARVAQKALSLGIYDGVGALTDAQKAQARYAIILDDTSRQHGNFALTSKGLANQQRIMAAQFENLAGKLGQVLLPIMTAAVGAAATFAENFESMIPFIVGAAAAISTVFIPSIIRMAETFATKTGAIGLFITGLAMIAQAVAKAVDQTIPEAQKLREVLESPWADPGLKKMAQQRLNEIFAEQQAAMERWKVGWRNSGIPETIGGVMGALTDAAEKGLRDGSLRINEAGMIVGTAISDPITKGAEKAARAVVISDATIIASIEATRNRLIGGAQTAADAIYDPIIVKAALAATEIEIAEQRKIITSKKSTRAQVVEAQGRVAELQKTWITQNTQLLTYGTEAEQISKTKAFLASGWWATAYKNATPEQKLALDEWKITLQNQVNGLVSNSTQGGKAAAQGFGKSLRAGKDDVYIAAGTVTGAARKELGDTSGYHGYGKSIIGQLAAGIIAGKVAARTAAQQAAFAVRDVFESHSPPGPASPLHRIDEWGVNLAREYADSIAGQADYLGRKLRDFIGQSPIQLGTVRATLAPGAATGGAAGAGQVIHGGVHAPISVNLPPGWRGSSADVSVLADQLANHLRLSMARR
jgi:hypothetical protein